MTQRDLEDFIFQPGFSTAERVTEVSGRGVGMDVVRKNVQALRGSISVASEQGRGTTFTICVPLDVSILDCTIVESAGQCFAVPDDRVIELVSLSAPPSAAVSTFELRGKTLPCVRLSAWISQEHSRERLTVLIVSHAGGPVGLVVDHSQGSQPLVLRTVGPLVRGLPIVAGAAVLGSGEVAILLDVDKLIESAAQPANELPSVAAEGGEVRC